MDAEFEFSSQTLVVQYQVKSQTKDKLAIFDGITRDTARGPKWDRFLAYVSFEPPSTLAIKRIIPPLPTLKNVEFAFVPFAHILYEDTHYGEIRLSVPVVEYNPYYPPSPRSVYSQVMAQFVELVLEYTIINENIGVEEVEGLPNLYRLHRIGSTPISIYQISLNVEAPKPGVPVKQRRDMFERV